MNKKEVNFLNTIKSIKKIDDIVIDKIKIGDLNEDYDCDFDKYYYREVSYKINGIYFKYRQSTGNIDLISKINLYPSLPSDMQKFVDNTLSYALINKLLLCGHGIDVFKHKNIIEEIVRIKNILNKEDE
jgi:hypothetical protein